MADWLSEAKVARAKKVEELVSDIMDDSRMSGVPRYHHRYDEDHHLLAHEVERLHRDINACWERIDELEDGIQGALAILDRMRFDRVTPLYEGLTALLDGDDR